MFGEEGYNPFQAEHAQCNKCGKMLRGPHKDRVFEDTNVYAADRERVYTRDEAEAAGLRHNVSGSLCPDCFQATRDKLKADQARAALQGPVPGHRAEVKEARRLNHERHQAQLEAYKEARADYQQNIQPAERAREQGRQIAKESAHRVETGQEEVS